MAREAKEAMAPSSGVDALIAKLRDEGVSAGRGQANKIVSDAEAKAKEIVDKADAEAKRHVEESRKDADAYRSAAEEAIKSAMRDTILDMKSRLMERFSGDVKRLVSEELKNQEMLKQMILEVAGRARASVEAATEGKVEFVLPEKAVGLEELRGKPDELKSGQLTNFVRGVADEMVREGVTFSTSDDVEAGIRIHVEKDDLKIDLTDEAVAGLLLQHLQPRFRAILEGIVK